MLNLRSKEPAVEPRDVIGPDETPPGLEAIRAWIRKPRPWLQGVRLWIRQFAKWYRAFRKWAGDNAVPAARRAAELAARGAEVARAVGKAGAIAGDVAKHIGDAGRALQNRDGRVGQFSRAAVTRAAQVREFSVGVAQSAKSTAAAGDALAQLRKMLPSRHKSGNDSNVEQDDSGPSRRLVPVTRRRTQRSVSEPSESQRKPVPESSEARQQTRLEAPSATTDAPPGPPKASRSRRRAAPAPGGKKDESAPSSSPGPSPAEVRRAAELARLPWPLVARVEALRPKTRKRVLWPLIVDVIRERGWTTSAELGLILGVSHRNLARRHLRPMVEAGLLELRHPDVVSHRYQAYRVREEPSAEGASGARD